LVRFQPPQPHSWSPPLSYKSKADQAAASRKYYEKHKDKAKAAAREWNKQQYKLIKGYVEQYKREHPCVDCGEGDPIVLDFDHVRGVKRFSVANAARGKHAMSTVIEEIAKCEVRCANCHRRVTHKRRVEDGPAKPLRERAREADTQLSLI
jgi:hypothetical protein